MSPEQDDEYWSTVYPFTKEDFLYYATKEHSKRPLHGLKNIPFYVFEETGVTLKSKEKQVNYTGNEAEYFLVEKIYLHALTTFEWLLVVSEATSFLQVL
jgi:hypothetical protein